MFVLLYFLNPLRSVFESLPWFGVLLILAVLAYRLGGWGLTIVISLLTAFAAATGLWVPAMQTLYLCGASALVACLLGIPIGFWASRSDRVQAVVTPIIDTLQTIPSFCFIIPVVMLFRVGDVTAMIATVAFAIVPAVRYTNHGLRQVPQHLPACSASTPTWRPEHRRSAPSGSRSTAASASATSSHCSSATC